MKPDKQPTEPAKVHELTDEELLSGGLTLTVKDNQGQDLPVKVVECPILQYQDYFQAIGLKDLGRELSLTTDCTPEQLNRLSQASALLLEAKSREVNAHFFSKAVEELKPETATQLDTLLANVAGMEEKLAEQLSSQGLATTSPNSAPQATPSNNSQPSEPSA